MLKLLLRFSYASLFFLFIIQLGHAQSLTLQQAEKAALSYSSELKALQAKEQSLQKSAIAAGQLNDPTLTLGTINVPTDTFNFSQEDMTQIQIGIQQSFPKGHSLHYRAMRQRELATAVSKEKSVTNLKILQNVRASWVNLYYWLTSKKIILQEEQIFRYWIDANASMLANNKAQQKDVVRAQLELSNLENQIFVINEKISISRAELARWIGLTLAQKANPLSFPRWPILPNFSTLLKRLQQHPELKVDTAIIRAGQANVQFAKQQYVPGFSLAVAYGIREGQHADGEPRANFISAQISMDLPFFPKNRQDKILQSNESLLISDKANQMSHYRQLNEATKIQYTIWQQNHKSLQIYRLKLIPEAAQYTQATIAAYRNNQTDFPTLARAYINELNMKLAELKTELNLNLANINLLYLQGK